MAVIYMYLELKFFIIIVFILVDVASVLQSNVFYIELLFIRFLFNFS